MAVLLAGAIASAWAGSQGGCGGHAQKGAESCKSSSADHSKCAAECSGKKSSDKKCGKECGSSCEKHGKAAAGSSSDGAAAPATQSAKAQTTCPVMGEEVDRKIFADVKGKRVYLCCEGCVAAVKADPDKYLKKLADAGVTVEQAPK